MQDLEIIGEQGSDPTKRIVTIGGIKLEVDLRYAKRVEHYFIGQSVKVLQKNYGDTFTVKYGVIVDFGNFQAAPSIDILVLDPDKWEQDPLKFVTITATTKDFEIAPLGEIDGLFNQKDIVQKIDDAIGKAELNVTMLKNKRATFLARFSEFFKPRTIEG